MAGGGGGGGGGVGGHGGGIIAMIKNQITKINDIITSFHLILILMVLIRTPT